MRPGLQAVALCLALFSVPGAAAFLAAPITMRGAIRAGVADLRCALVPRRDALVLGGALVPALAFGRSFSSPAGAEVITPRFGEGPKGIPAPQIGVGTWAWGDDSVWGYKGYDKSLTFETIEAAFRTSIEQGVTFFDTAEVENGPSSPNPATSHLKRTNSE